jgi:hypothetical protein
VTVLCLCLLLSGRDGRDSDQETSAHLEWDSLTLGAGARIFDPEDWDFVGSEASRHFTRQFRKERTALALDWLRAVRSQVNQSIRAHLRAARGNADLKPADEIRLWLDFLRFQATSGILYLMVWTYGPPRAAKLLGYSQELAEKVRQATEDLLPAGHHVAVELIDGKPQGKS